MEDRAVTADVARRFALLAIEGYEHGLATAGERVADEIVDLKTEIQAGRDRFVSDQKEIEAYRAETSRRCLIQERLETEVLTLRQHVSLLQDEAGGTNVQIADLKIEVERLTKLKEQAEAHAASLEDNNAALSQAYDQVEPYVRAGKFLSDLHCRAKVYRSSDGAWHHTNGINEQFRGNTLIGLLDKVEGKTDGTD